MACVCLVEGFVGHETSLWIFLLLPAASQTLVVVAGFLRGTLRHDPHHVTRWVIRTFMLLQIVGAAYIVWWSEGARWPAAAIAIFHFIICTLCGLCCRNGISRQLALTIWYGGALPN